jgi:hypothetical protein
MPAIRASSIYWSSTKRTTSPPPPARITPSRVSGHASSAPISPHFQHRLFLTATPHNGYTESFTSLLELLDDQRFARNILPDEKQLSQVMIRRLKSDLVDADGKPLYAQRKLQALAVPYTDEEREIHQKLNDYCASREKDAEKTGKHIRHFVRQSTAQEAPLLVARRVRCPRSRSTSPRCRMAAAAKSKDAMAERILRKAILKVEEDYANDQEVENAQSEAVEEASRRPSRSRKTATDAGRL